MRLTAQFGTKTMRSKVRTDVSPVLPETSRILWNLNDEVNPDPLPLPKTSNLRKLGQILFADNAVYVNFRRIVFRNFYEIQNVPNNQIPL